jgi:hypothetical protein
MNRIWAVIILCLFVSGFVAAQDSATEAPLIAIVNGQMYRLQGDALVEYDACMPDEAFGSQFASSPDGTKFAFATLPKIISAAIDEFGGLGDMPISLNLWYCDTTTDTLLRFQAMEGSDEPFDGELPAASPINSTPEWSPDSSQIAWSSAAVDGTSYTLHIYDIATGEVTESPLDLPPPFLFPIPPTLYWGEDHIYMTLASFNEETFLNEELLYTYDLETDMISNQVILLTEGESSDFITDRLLLNVDGKAQFAVNLFEGGWLLTDPATGEQTPLAGVPLAHGQNGLDDVNALADVTDEFSVNWQIVGTEPPFVLEGYPFQRIAFSPDGTQMAYADSTLHIWSDGAVRDIANSDGFADDAVAHILWGETQWTAAAGEEVAEAPLPTCEGTQQSRLNVGDNARLISTTVPNRLRANPTTAGDQIGVIAAAGEFTILEGPVCANGYAWYRVQYLDMQGWTAEGSAEAYFIEPMGE